MRKWMALLLAAVLMLSFPSVPAEETDWAQVFFDGLSQLESLLPPKEKSAMTYDEAVTALRSLGFEIPDSEVEKAKAWVKESRWPVSAGSFAQLLLMGIGTGTFDEKTFARTSTSDQVYAFDAEIFDITWMYRDFLEGIGAIIPGFRYTDAKETIQENERPVIDSANAQEYWEKYVASLQETGRPPSEGTTTVSFILNGHEYRKELDFYGDWFNEDAIGWINEVLSAEGFDGQLYEFFDGGQGLILIYGSLERAEAVQKILETD